MAFRTAAFNWSALGGQPLEAWAGNRLPSVAWGAVDPAAEAVPAGRSVCLLPGLDAADGVDGAVTLVGPASVSEVMAALLTALRALPGMRCPQGATDEVRDCEYCPRVGFCGWQAVPHGADVGVGFRALWSRPFCHTGVGMCLDMYNPSWFLPAAAQNALPLGVDEVARVAAALAAEAAAPPPRVCGARGCSATPAALSLCGGCRGAMYCSREHQRAHWAPHKPACRAAAAAGGARGVHM